MAGSLRDALRSGHVQTYVRFSGLWGFLDGPTRAHRASRLSPSRNGRAQDTHVKMTCFRPWRRFREGLRAREQSGSSFRRWAQSSNMGVVIPVAWRSRTCSSVSAPATSLSVRIVAGVKRLAAVQDASLRGLTRPRLAACMSKDRRCRIGPAGFIAAHSASARIGEAGEPLGWSKLVGAVT